MRSVLSGGTCEASQESRKIVSGSSGLSFVPNACVIYHHQYVSTLAIDPRLLLPNIKVLAGKSLYQQLRCKDQALMVPRSARGEGPRARLPCRYCRTCMSLGEWSPNNPQTHKWTAKSRSIKSCCITAADVPANLLSDLVHDLPQLLDYIGSASLAGLLATSPALRKQVQQHVTKVSNHLGPANNGALSRGFGRRLHTSASVTYK